jgi:hypothetical protein
MVEICSVYDKVSKNGNRYLVVRLGKARILLFEADPTADGTPVWSVFLQADPSPVGQKNTSSNVGRAPRQHPLLQKPAAKPVIRGDLPDDDVADLWRTEP